MAVVSSVGPLTQATLAQDALFLHPWRRRSRFPLYPAQRLGIRGLRNPWSPTRSSNIICSIGVAIISPNWRILLHSVLRLCKLLARRRLLFPATVPDKHGQDRVIDITWEGEESRSRVGRTSCTVHSCKASNFTVNGCGLTRNCSLAKGRCKRLPPLRGWRRRSYQSYSITSRLAQEPPWQPQLNENSEGRKGSNKLGMRVSGHPHTHSWDRGIGQRRISCILKRIKISHKIG